MDAHIIQFIESLDNFINFIKAIQDELSELSSYIRYYLLTMLIFGTIIMILMKMNGFAECYLVELLSYI